MGTCGCGLALVFVCDSALAVPDADSQSGDDTTTIVVAVVCGIIGLILLSVLVVIIVRQWQVKKKGAKETTQGKCSC